MKLSKSQPEFNHANEQLHNSDEKMLSACFCFCVHSFCHESFLLLDVPDVFHFEKDGSDRGTFIAAKKVFSHPSPDQSFDTVSSLNSAAVPSPSWFYTNLFVEFSLCHLRLLIVDWWGEKIKRFQYNTLGHDKMWKVKVWRLCEHAVGAWLCSPGSSRACFALSRSLPEKERHQKLLLCYDFSSPTCLFPLCPPLSEGGKSCFLSLLSSWQIE